MPNTGNNPNDFLLMNKQINYIYSVEYYSAIKKTIDIHNSLDESQMHYIA